MSTSPGTTRTDLAISRLSSKPPKNSKQPKGKKSGKLQVDPKTNSNDLVVHPSVVSNLGGKSLRKGTNNVNNTRVRAKNASVHITEQVKSSKNQPSDVVAPSSGQFTKEAERKGKGQALSEEVSRLEGSLVAHRAELKDLMRGKGKLSEDVRKRREELAGTVMQEEEELRKAKLKLKALGKTGGRRKGGKSAVKRDSKERVDIDLKEDPTADVEPKKTQEPVLSKTGVSKRRKKLKKQGGSSRPIPDLGGSVVGASEKAEVLSVIPTKVDDAVETRRLERLKYARQQVVSYKKMIKEDEDIYNRIKAEQDGMGALDAVVPADPRKYKKNKDKMKSLLDAIGRKQKSLKKFEREVAKLNNVDVSPAYVMRWTPKRFGYVQLDEGGDTAMTESEIEEEMNNMSNSTRVFDRARSYVSGTYESSLEAATTGAEQNLQDERTKTLVSTVISDLFFSFAVPQIGHKYKDSNRVDIEHLVDVEMLDVRRGQEKRMDLVLSTKTNYSTCTYNHKRIAALATEPSTKYSEIENRSEKLGVEIYQLMRGGKEEETGIKQYDQRFYYHEPDGVAKDNMRLVAEGLVDILDHYNYPSQVPDNFDMKKGKQVSTEERKVESNVMLIEKNQEITGSQQGHWYHGFAVVKDHDTYTVLQTDYGVASMRSSMALDENKVAMSRDELIKFLMKGKCAGLAGIPAGPVDGDMQGKINEVMYKGAEKIKDSYSIYESNLNKFQNPPMKVSERLRKIGPKYLDESYIMYTLDTRFPQRDESMPNVRDDKEESSLERVEETSDQSEL